MSAKINENCSRSDSIKKQGFPREKESPVWFFWYSHFIKKKIKIK